VGQTTAPSRRLTSRVDVGDGVWVYWRCNGREDVSRVRNLSIGGLYIETFLMRGVGIKAGITANLDFLVQEGQIRAEAVVRHAAAHNGKGVGLKFVALSEADRPNLAALMSRLRSLSR
jgi:hypothetical protein